MCTEQTRASLRSWLRDPLIRLVMESDGVTEEEMITLVRRVCTAVAARSETIPAQSQWRVAEHMAAGNDRAVLAQ